MARIDGQFGILFETQPVEGTLAPGLTAIVAAPGGPYGESDGLVLGDTDSGVGESGISLTLGRNFDEKGDVAGSFTRLFDDFLNGASETFSFAFPIAGNRSTPGPAAVDADFQVAIGIRAIYSCCGLVGQAWGGGLGQEYVPANTSFTSALVFDSGTVYAIIDMAGNLDFDLTAGEKGVQTGTFTAKLDVDSSGGAFAFPTLNFGAQQTESPPSVKEVANVFGGQSRGFGSLSVAINNEIEEVADSNAVDGLRIEQAGREISFSTVMDVDDADITFDFDNLVAAAAQTDIITFQLGDVNADDGTDPAEAVLFELNGVNLNSLGLDQPARSKANVLDGFCTSTLDGGEFSIVFN